MKTPEGPREVVFLDTDFVDVDVQVGANLVASLLNSQGKDVVAGHAFLSPSTQGRRPALAIHAVSVDDLLARASAAQCPTVATPPRIWDDSPEDCLEQPIEDIRDDAVEVDDEIR